MPKPKESFIPALALGWLTAYYDALAHSFLPEKKFKTALIRQANIRAGDKVLDFGSGTATLTILAWQHQSKAELIGLDIDPSISATARKKIARQKVPIQIDVYDGSALPYPDHYFDRILSSLTFHHLNREQKKFSLKEILRVLKSGGELHIADWGKAQNAFMRFLFYFVQVFDGFSRTHDNVKGLLPQFLGEAGFENVKETKKFSTIVGTLSLYSGVKKS